MENQKTLLLFTRTFPYENVEFLSEEIVELSHSFKKIIVIPTFVRDLTIKHEVPNNVEVIPLLWSDYSKKKKKLFFKHGLFVINVLFKEFITSSYNFKTLRPVISSALFSQYLSIRFRDIIRAQTDELILYSFWMNENATALTFCKESHFPHAKFVFRCHGYDLYNERRPSGYIPFRSRIYDAADKIFTISKDGYNYIVKNFDEVDEKVCVSRIGTKDFGMGVLPSSEFYHIVSCSSVIPVKRLYKIIDVLSNTSSKVKWTHIGDGNLKELKKYAAESLPSNVECNFKGNLTHEKVINFYKKRPVDCFINLSSSEGIPVSIMEAISFGIPVIGNDVGGVGEIVDDVTGKLFSSDEKTNIIAKYIDSKFLGFKTRNDEYRFQVRQYWKDNFSAQKNYSVFIEEILK